jgi:hypothetical protein
MEPGVLERMLLEAVLLKKKQKEEHEHAKCELEDANVENREI